MVVYVDILVALNLIVNYFLLLSVLIILGCKIKTYKLLISAFLGALSSLYIFLPQVSVLMEFIFKTVVCLTMSFIAFGCKNTKRFLKAAGLLFAITCAYAGVMIAVWRMFKPYGMIVNNSVVYFDISPLILVCFTVIAYFVFLILNKIFARSSQNAQECDVSLEFDGKKLELRAILDTGNSITDVFGKSEVIITDKFVLKDFLGVTELRNNEKFQSRFRLIPCNTVSGDDMLEGFRCDCGVVKSNDKTVILEKPILAISKTTLNDSYNAIINPKILD